MTNTPKQTVYGRGKKLSKPKTHTKKINSIRNPFILKKKEKEKEKKKKHKIIKDKIIRDNWSFYETEINNKERKKLERKKEEINHRLIKDRIISDIRTLFEKEDDYYKPKRVSNFCNNNYIEYKSNGDKNKLITRRIS